MYFRSANEMILFDSTFTDKPVAKFTIIKHYLRMIRAGDWLLNFYYK